MSFTSFRETAATGTGREREREMEWQFVRVYFDKYMSMRDVKEGRKKQARSYKQKPKQHSTPKAATFPKKNELPQVHVTVGVCMRGVGVGE